MAPVQSDYMSTFGYAAAWPVEGLREEPRAGTVRAIAHFAAIKPEEFEECFIAHMAGLVALSGGKLVATVPEPKESAEFRAHLGNERHGSHRPHQMKTAGWSPADGIGQWPGDSIRRTSTSHGRRVNKVN